MPNIKSRIELALDFLKDGEGFTIGDLRLNPIDDSLLQVIGFSNYYTPQHLTKAKAIEELNDTKRIFQELVKASADLKKFIETKKVEYHLALEYGKGTSMLICKESEGNFKWETELSE